MSGRLFRQIPPLSAMLEKSAAAPIGNVPDDVEKWPAHVASEIQRVFPFLGRFDVSINIDKVDAEAGYGAGYAMVRNFSARNLPQSEVTALRNYVRIPIIIQERKLQRPSAFELGGQFYALNKQRIAQAMSSSQIFDGSDDVSKASTSLLDDMFPPYQQRNGAGRIYDASSIGGTGKVASVSDMLKVAELARHRAAALREAGAEKVAYSGLNAPKAGAYFGDREWIEQFYHTPFFSEAQSLLLKDAQSDLEQAKRRAAAAEGAIEDARLDVEGAELSAKLASFKNKHAGVPENETLSKLSSCCYSADSWAGEFAQTPMFEDALRYRAKTAAREAKRAADDASEDYDKRWRERRKGSSALEAKLAAWKYEQATGKEFKAEKKETQKEAEYEPLSATLYGAAGGAMGGGLLPLALGARPRLSDIMAGGALGAIGGFSGGHEAGTALGTAMGSARAVGRQRDVDGAAGAQRHEELLAAVRGSPGRLKDAFDGANASNEKRSSLGLLGTLLEAR